MQMLDLKAIRAAALEARHGDGEERTIIGPNSADAVLGPPQILEMVDNLEALGKLVRDLTGYLKMTAGDKPDPVREDLLENARQLLEAIGA